MATIRRQYFNPKLSGSFGGLSGFLKNRKFRDKKEVEEELKKLRAYALHRPALKTYPRRKIFVPFKDYQWCSDLLDMQAFQAENRGFRFILIIICSFSKTLFTVPIKTKSGPDITRAFKKVLKSSKRKPIYLWTDQGLEYRNSVFKDLLKREKITLFHTFSKLKSVFAERVIRTLRTRLERLFTHRGNFKYIDALPQITASYNSSYHSSIKMAPRDVVGAEREEEVWLNLFDEMIRKDLEHVPKPKFQLYDLVRISKEKLVFEKGYKANWSEELFRIIKVNPTSPPTYTLEDMNGESISGGFLDGELQLYSRVEGKSTTTTPAAAPESSPTTPPTTPTTPTTSK
jgi:hypothetical protein